MCNGSQMPATLAHNKTDFKMFVIAVRNAENIAIKVESVPIFFYSSVVGITVV